MKFIEMASSIFTQSFCQPQVAACVSHLSALLGGTHVMSSHREVCMRQTHTTVKSMSAVHKDSTPRISQQTVEPLNLDHLQEMLREVDEVSTPVTSLVEQAQRSRGKGIAWFQYHTSAKTFFENKTGFPKSHLNMDIPSLYTAVRDPLFRNIFNSLVHNSHDIQLRGFKTFRSNKKTGLGMEKRDPPEDSLVDKLQDLFSNKNFVSRRLGSILSQSSTSSSSTSGLESNPELEQRIKVSFTEGYMAREENTKKKEKSIIRGLVILTLVLSIVMLIHSRTSIKFGGSLGFLNGTTYEVNAEDVNVTFEDVKGAAEAKQELQDIVNFLKDPEKYTSLGAKLPKGVLLVGPPGVGKTLLARAVAGEAGVPFFHASGSEFDELFVGQGAKRVRQLFTAAKEQAPCIIFIDEFDSVGAKRTSSAVHPYANQTVNQLLSEMDGFLQNEGIIVMGATNKVENMDKALRRPGRFDVEVVVRLPDLKGRKEIIELYISKIKKDPSVDVEKLAKGTTGFSGAEIENLVNQAALKAVIVGSETVTMGHLEFSKDKIIMGPERKHRIPDMDTNWITAYHEAGHTLVAHFSKDAVPLHKVTIIPRGQSLGHTSFIDEKEVYNRTVSQLKANMDTAMGGRAAEELVYGTDKVTTGASVDLEGATRIATAMVMVSGMSEKVGLRSFSDAEISPAQRELIDIEIKRMLQEAYDRAKSLLKQHNHELNLLAHALMKYETLDREEIKAVVEGKTLHRSP